MAMTRSTLWAVAATLACAGPVLADGCDDRIAALESSLSAAAGSGPAVTGSLSTSTEADNRIPAKRPAEPEAVGAQTGAAASVQTQPAASEALTSRLPANRPPVADAAAAQAQNEASIRSEPMTESRRSDIVAVIAEAKALSRQGREADCRRALAKVDNR